MIAGISVGNRGRYLSKRSIAVHVAPSSADLRQLTDEFAKIINESRYSAPETATIAQFLFEKIHPFARWKRAGREALLGTFVASRKIRNEGLIPLEEFIDGHREQYYEALEPTRNVASFVEFFLNGLIVQSEIVLKKISTAELFSNGLAVASQQ